MFVLLWQVKIKRKPKSTEKDSGPTSPTVPSITYDSVFDSGRELSSDVYSTVGTGTFSCSRICANRKKMFIFKQKKTHTWVLDIKGPLGANPAVKHSGTNSSVAAETHRRMKTPERLRTFMKFSEEAAKRCLI